MIGVACFLSSTLKILKQEARMGKERKTGSGWREVTFAASDHQGTSSSWKTILQMITEEEYSGLKKVEIKLIADDDPP